MVVKRVLPIKGPIKYGEWHWDTKGVPPGPIVITVDLDAVFMSSPCGLVDQFFGNLIFI